MRRKILPGWAAVLALLLASLCFLLLYRYDNKYTASGKQAANGILVLTERELEKDPVRFLRDGWKFYADELLTPETLPSAAGGTDLSIGSVNRFDHAGGSPHGCGSYVLRLSLPKRERTYAVELPEIYSACKFYVNGDILTQIGDPDPENYTDRTQIRMVTFRASGEVTMLLAVSDYSHYYSGLIYPPSFGEPSAVSALSMSRQGIAASFLAITLLAAFLALYFAFRLHHGDVLIFALLCLTSAAAGCYPLLHMYWDLPVQPWYMLELCASYLVTFFVVLLHGRLCRTPAAAALAANITVASFCVLSALYGGLSAMLSVPVIRLFSGTVAVFKLAAAAYLLTTACIALWRRVEVVRPLFWADIFYAAAYLWDRVLPDFEPIRTGWFAQWGAFAVIFAMGFVLWRNTVSVYRSALTLTEKHRQMERELAIQVEHLRQMTEKVEESRRIRHDFRQHLRVISGLAQDGRDGEIVKYVAGITELNESTAFLKLAENVELDALLHYYYELAKKNGIRFQLRLELPAELGVSVIDLGSILGNLLENALEACMRQREGQMFVRLGGRMEDDRLVFILDNSFDGVLNRTGERLMSRKHEGVGLGVESVRELVRRNGGIFNVHPREQVFQVDISLPVEHSEKNDSKPPLASGGWKADSRLG